MIAVPLCMFLLSIFLLSIFFSSHSILFRHFISFTTTLQRVEYLYLFISCEGCSVVFHKPPSKRNHKREAYKLTNSDKGMIFLLLCFSPSFNLAISYIDYPLVLCDHDQEEEAKMYLFVTTGLLYCLFFWLLFYFDYRDIVLFVRATTVLTVISSCIGTQQKEITKDRR